MTKTLGELGAKAHQLTKRDGFWDEDHDPARKLMLIVSELGEAIEELRAGRGITEIHNSWHSTPHLRGLSDLTMTGGKSFLHYGTPAQREVSDADYLAAGFIAKPEGFPIELADVILRTLDACHAWGIDIDEAVARKMAYNATRGHMGESGKRF